MMFNVYVGDSHGAFDFPPNKEDPHMILNLESWKIDVTDIMTLYDFFLIEEICDIIEACSLTQVQTLIHCHGGKDRSPFIFACYYVRKDIQPHRAYEIVKEKHAPTIVHDDWLNLFYHAHIDSDEIILVDTKQ